MRSNSKGLTKLGKDKGKRSLSATAIGRHIYGFHVQLALDIIVAVHPFKTKKYEIVLRAPL